MSTNNGKQGEFLKNVTMNNMFVGEKHLCIQQHTLLNTSVAAFREEILKQTGYFNQRDRFLIEKSDFAQ